MEATIFDYMKNVLFTKKSTFSNLSEDQLNFQPYMLQRWCSMASTDSALILNETTNKWLLSQNNKQLFYKTIISVLPKHKQKKVAYIKKVTKSNSVDNIKDIGHAAELSQREIREYINF